MSERIPTRLAAENRGSVVRTRDGPEGKSPARTEPESQRGPVSRYYLAAAYIATGETRILKRCLRVVPNGSERLKTIRLLTVVLWLEKTKPCQSDIRTMFASIIPQSSKTFDTFLDRVVIDLKLLARKKVGREVVVELTVEGRKAVEFYLSETTLMYQHGVLDGILKSDRDVNDEPIVSATELDDVKDIPPTSDHS